MLQKPAPPRSCTGVADMCSRSPEISRNFTALQHYSKWQDARHLQNVFWCYWKNRRLQKNDQQTVCRWTVRCWTDQSDVNLIQELPCPAGNGTGPFDSALAALSASAKNASGLALTAFQIGQQVALQCVINSTTDWLTQTGWTFRTGPTWGADYLQRARHRELFFILICSAPGKFLASLFFWVLFFSELLCVHLGCWLLTIFIPFITKGWVSIVRSHVS